MSVSTRSSGEACLALVVSKESYSSEVAKGPQPSLKNCKEQKRRRGKGTHPLMDRQEKGEGHVCDLGLSRETWSSPRRRRLFSKELEEQRRQSEGIHWLKLLWPWSQLWMLLFKSYHEQVWKESILLMQKGPEQKFCRRVEGGIAVDEGVRTEIHLEIAVSLNLPSPLDFGLWWPRITAI